MSKILFNSIKNISAGSVVVAGTTIPSNGFLYICKDPKYFTNYMSDIVSLYTRGFLYIFDTSYNVIASENVWNSIDYNIQIGTNPELDTSNIPASVSEYTTLNGYESGVICSPTQTMLLVLPIISTLIYHKRITIKNISTYAITLTRSGDDTIDGISTTLVLNSLESIILMPNTTLSTWVKVSSFSELQITPTITTALVASPVDINTLTYIRIGAISLPTGTYTITIYGDAFANVFGYSTIAWNLIKYSNETLLANGTIASIANPHSTTFTLTTTELIEFRVRGIGQIINANIKEV